ncbi:sulfatase family protein [Niabella aurantiaca]|uniref:sulfatase family protein n=1 Tax=Niabella aurantiaca TaxID=379900 RepID=UPI000377A48B|nr:arylsulfatase [Niabella aurantiaca]
MTWVVFLTACNAVNKKSSEHWPNVIVVYVDDLGYGDLGCYGATAVKTPNVDQLAAQGLRFTDAHATAATCTPSRFSLLTGSYAFRNNAAILPGDAPLLIRPGTPTMPGMFQRSGYKTAVIGKWHLGLGNGTPDWNGTLKPGPLEVGFNYSFIIPATLDRVPTVYVEDHKVANLDPSDPIKVDYQKKIGDWPTGLERPDLLKFGADTQHSNTITDGISRIGYMTGGKAALWKDEEMADRLIRKTDTFIAKNRKAPFFLYFSFTDIHVPRDPAPRFKGKTKMGSRGDAIVQMDGSVGALMKILEKYGVADNTLIVFTSDNGGVLDDGYSDDAVRLAGTHDPAGGLSGGKYSAYEAGTRVPAILWWPGRIEPGTSAAMISQVDLYASFAALLGEPLQANEAPDSENMLEALLGRTAKGRRVMLEESFTMALREGQWKYIAPRSGATPGWLQNKTIPTGLSGRPQLYDLAGDIKEQNNQAAADPQRVAGMQKILEDLLQKPTRKGYVP